ncbi:YqgE/AlgH family protein [Roseomonas sp. GC11]|uniref:YqgE/AlgH family protein n=1 Tax=Roseomonas sp. GC11 TaxID=2950546 RepID=UPI00210BB756|nr:YqgE/AlgH family protein [Roseomonas sp. GC11]MCQ4161777.1 YqgE/AlgH family protein [Roseomonas sp. GC11]
MARRAREDEIPEAFGGRPRGARPGTMQAGYLGGQLLVAMPGMQDPRFVRTVICLCAHSADGAMGIVLNKPLSNISFEELMKQLEVEPTPPQRQIRLMAGGPVEGGRGFVLHTNDWASEGSLQVTGGVALTASLDILKAIAGGGGPRLGLLALGYAGWGPGQLEDEMLRNAWLNVPADESLLFGGTPDDKWRMALAKLRVDPLLLSGHAGHA